MSQSQKESGSGKILFGDKSLEYLKKKSRIATEDYTDTSVLYFEMDYESSKRNFYGEMIVKKWKNALGVKVNAIVNITEADTTNLEGIPNKLLTGEVTVYIEHLKELGIEPQIGDYFTSKNRIYFIHDRTIADSNKVQVAVDREAIFIMYHIVESDDEQTQVIGTDIKGTKNDITGQRQ